MTTHNLHVVPLGFETIESQNIMIERGLFTCSPFGI